MKNYPTKKLGEVCEIKTGRRDANHGNPDGKYHFFTCADKHSYIDDYSFDTEAILVAGNGDVGAAKYFKGKFDAYQRTYVLHNFSDDIDVQFLFIFINGFLKKVAQNAKQGGTMPYIKLGLLKNFEIPLPSLSEQKRIVKILDEKLGAVREAIALRESALADTEKILSARLLEIFEKGKEEGWEEKGLSEASDYFIGLTYKPSDKSVEDGTIVLRSSNIQNDQLDFSDIVRVTTKIKEKLFVKEGDILMCTRNGSKRLVGKTARITELKEPMTFGTFMTIIRGEYNDFLYWFLKSEKFFDQFDHGGGPMINQITLKMLNNIKVPFPNLTTQQKIVAELDELSNRIAELRALQTEQLADLKRLEKAYLREAFNGEF